jgi:ubiquinone/menaquinone biosynthesis C-methylase UbiE
MYMAAAPRTTVLDRLSVLADPTRSRILLLLDRHELTVGELCTIMQLPQSTVSRHLKLLADDAWLVARGDGTSRFYKMVSSRLDQETRALWSVVRAQMSGSAGATQDTRRAAGVLAKRRDKALIFFRDSAETWDKMRADMIGERTDLLALLDLLDEHWVVGDLGCGAGHISEALAPCVAKVIAVDESGPMLGVAKQRLEEHANIELRVGTIEALPIDDGALDAAVLFLVAHFITDPSKVMHEVRRVLKPGGRLCFVEHGLAPDARVQRWQRRFEPVQKRVAGGCHITRQIPELIADAGFTVTDVDVFYSDGPKILGALSLGTAVA